MALCAWLIRVRQDHRELAFPVGAPGALSGLSLVGVGGLPRAAGPRVAVLSPTDRKVMAMTPDADGVGHAASFGVEAGRSAAPSA